MWPLTDDLQIHMRVSSAVPPPLESVTHTPRHILSDVSRVASRDSSRAMATMQDLYTALCEEEGIYSFFKTLEGAF